MVLFQPLKVFLCLLYTSTTITGQKAVATISRKDIANFKLRKKMPIGVMVTLRRERMYEFLEELVRVALPRIRDFKGIESKFDGKGNYTLGIQEQKMCIRDSCNASVCLLQCYCKTVAVACSFFRTDYYVSF